MKLQRKFIALVLLFICFNGFSQINVTTNFRILTNLPVDTRMVVADLTARDAISSFYRYEGMLVYVIGTQTNYQLVGGIANANWQTLLLTGSTYAAGTGLTLTGNTFSHEPHTGDVTGTTSLTVTAIQGRSLATVTPTSGNVLTWNGSAWAPAVASGTQYESGTGLILTGNTFSANTTASIWNAGQLQGYNIAVTAPSNNEVLKWDGTEWSPSTDANTFYTAGTGLTLSGTTFSANYNASIWNASQIQGQSVSATPPTTNQILKWNGSIWTPVDENAYAAGTGLTLTANTFNANNTSAIWNANQLYGSPVSTTAPSSDEVLKWDGTSWSPAADANTQYSSGTGIILAGNTFSADYTTPLWNANQLNGSVVSTTAPAANEILKWNGTEWAPSSDNNTTYTSGTGIILTGNTFSADNTTAIWNANQLNGSTISTSAPAGNDVLKWDGTEWAPAVDNNTTYAAGTGIILSGNTFSADNTSPIWNANQINGSTISTNAPAANEVLKWNGTEWIPSTDAGTTYAAGTGIILSGTTFSADNTSPIWNANQINGSVISTTAPASSEVLKWNGSEWAPSTDAGTTYTAGSGITLTGTTFSADNTTAIWNANQLYGSSISTQAPAGNDVLKWNGTEWTPSADAVNTYSAGSGITLTGTTFSLSSPVDVSVGGTGQTTYTNGQILIGNSTGTLTKNTLTSGTGISITNGDGSITINNSDPNATHTGDAIGASAITVVGLQGRTVATTVPTDGDVLTWNNASTSWIPSQSSSAYDGNRAVKRATWPSSVNMGTTTNVAAFLDAVFFPFISATITMNNLSVLYEIGTSNSVSITGSTTANDETSFSNGRVDQVYPTTTNVYTFGSAVSYSTSITFTPDETVPSTLELHFVAYQDVANNGSPITINSSTKYVQSCYPYLHGVSSDNLTSGGTTTYNTLSAGKLVQQKSNKTVTLTGTGYIYFCYPASYGALTSILDQNSFEQISAFTSFTANVISIGLTNNWTESYYIYQSNSQTTPAGWSYQFRY